MSVDTRLRQASDSVRLAVALAQPAEVERPRRVARQRAARHRTVAVALVVALVAITIPIVRHWYRESGVVGRIQKEEPNRPQGIQKVPLGRSLHGGAQEPRQQSVPMAPFDTPSPATSVASLGLVGRIAFAGDNDLSVMDLRTGKILRLTNSSRLEQESAWSRDGSHIAFAHIGEQYDDDSSYAPGGADMQSFYIVRPDGTQLRRIVIGEGAHPSRPTWSPDGEHIAFQLYFAGAGGEETGKYHLCGYQHNEIWVVAADGSRLRRLIGDACSNVGRPAWSPDGRRIAYVQNTEEEAEIYIFDVRSGSTKRLVMGTDPAWSPDGKRLAYVSRTEASMNGVGNGVAVIDADGSDAYIVSKSSDFYARPSWSPDGKWLTFDRDPDGHITSPSCNPMNGACVYPGGPEPASIWIVRANGKGLRKVIQGGDAGYPAWGPPA